MKYMVVSVRDVVVNFMYCNEILKKGIAISRFFARSDKAVVFLPDSFQTKNFKDILGWKRGSRWWPTFSDRSRMLQNQPLGHQIDQWDQFCFTPCMSKLSPTVFTFNLQRYGAINMGFAWLCSVWCGPALEHLTQGVDAQEPRDQLDDCEQCGEGDCGGLDAASWWQPPSLKIPETQVFFLSPWVPMRHMFV